MFIHIRQNNLHTDNNYPSPDRGTEYCNRAISLFVCLFVSLSAILRENGWIDLHEIFREGVEWPWDDLIQFWVIRVNGSSGSKVKLFVITGHSYLVWLWSSGSRVLPRSDWERNEIAVFGFSLRRTRRQGLLCPAPQLVFWVLMTSFKYDISKIFCNSVCWTFGTELNNMSSMHPLTNGMHNSKQACVLIRDVPDFGSGRSGIRPFIGSLLEVRPRSGSGQNCGRIWPDLGQPFRGPTEL